MEKRNDSVYENLTHRYYNMIDRCYCPTSINFFYYGAKGITVCKQWRKDREAFIEWALANGFHPDLQLDRINSERGYKPSNTRWVSQQENLANRCGNKPFKRKNGERLPRHVYRQGNKFIVRFYREKRQIHVGTYDTIRSAVIGRNKFLNKQ